MFEHQSVIFGVEGCRRAEERGGPDLGCAGEAAECCDAEDEQCDVEVGWPYPK